MIEKYPKLGVQTDIQNIRVQRENNYAIFYEIKNDVVEILSIWDCRQNPKDINL
jgi:hypothetical protein